jgi:hypothetical protein
MYGFSSLLLFYFGLDSFIVVIFRSEMLWRAPFPLLGLCSRGVMVFFSYCENVVFVFGSGAGDFPDEVSSTNRSPSNNKIFRGGENLILIFWVVTVHLVKIVFRST